MQTQDSLIRSKVLPIFALFRSKTVRQTFMLYSTQLIAIPIGVITSSTTTRTLGPDNFGIFSFYSTIIGFSVLFFRFGFASSGGLLIARENHESKIQKLIGSMTVIFILIGAGYSLFIFGFSFFVDDIFKTNIGYILKWAAIPLVAAPFQFMIGSITQGSNKIWILSLYQIMPKALSLMGMLALLAFSRLNVVSLIMLGLGVSTLYDLFVIGRLKPSFDDLRSNVRKIWSKNKKYGLHLYSGQIVDQATYRLDGILVSYFVNTTQLGFYNLSKTLISPMSMLSSSLSISLFRRFAYQERIPKKIIYFNFLWLIVCFAGITLIGKYVVIFLFSERFLSVTHLFIPLGI